MCWRVGFLCGRFPPLWCFPPRCSGAAPLRFLCRALLLALMSLCLDVSGIPVPGRPPGHQQDSFVEAAAAPVGCGMGESFVEAAAAPVGCGMMGESFVEAAGGRVEGAAEETAGATV